MTFHIPRRKFLKTAAGVGAAGLASTLPFGRDAQAQKTVLTGVIWGGPWVELGKTIAARQDKVDVRWELLQGGSPSIIPKIQASWPNVPYDFVGQFNPLFYLWEKEDWAEPLTVEEMPNLKDLAEESLFRNKKGQIITVPLDIGAAFWAYRKDICPVEIKTMEDLLNPKLKGKIVIRDVTQGLNNNTLSYALAFGGNEDNMEPGWQFLQKLAKSGNVARVGKAETDFINALTTGEAAVGFWNMGGWGTVAKTFPVEYLIKDKKQAPGFQAFMFNEAFMIPRTGKNIKATKEFLNFFVNKENNEEWNRVLNFAPTNVKSARSELAKLIVFDKKEDREKYQYNIRYDVLNAQREAMLKRFETDVIPLLK
ncbi:MAG: extracellular solute-binding protein [Rhodospirillales bacterium]|nr:extracellular solute-binding protein [Rhodospirillales bacterium]